MMRILRTFALSAGLLLATQTHAQKLVYGSFQNIGTEQTLQVDWDCSKTRFERTYNEQEWAEIHGLSNWQQAQTEAMNLILYIMNNRLKKTHFSLVPAKEGLNTRYTLLIRPTTLDRKGNNDSQYVLHDNLTQKDVGILRQRGDGGHWGDLANLLGDGYEEAAGKVGKYLRNIWKSQQKKNKKK